MKKMMLGFMLFLAIQPGVQAEDFLAKRVAKLGQPAPEFTLQDLDGKPFNLAEQKGKVVLIHFWSAKCPFVIRYEERLKQLNEDYRDKGVVMIGIDSNITETLEQIKEVAAERKLSYSLLLDPNHKTADDYGAITTPHVYIINKEGTLVYEGAVDDQGWNEKDPVNKKHAREALDAVLSGQPVPTPETKTAGCTIKRSK